MATAFTPPSYHDYHMQLWLPQIWLQLVRPRLETAMVVWLLLQLWPISDALPKATITAIPATPGPPSQISGTIPENHDYLLAATAPILAAYCHLSSLKPTSHELE